MKDGIQDLLCRFVHFIFVVTTMRYAFLFRIILVHRLLKLQDGAGKDVLNLSFTVCVHCYRLMGPYSEQYCVLIESRA